MSIISSTLMCHAPIVVPDVGAERAQACAQSTAAMRAAAQHIVAKAPELVVLVSPHTPRLAHAFSAVGGPRLVGDFGSFGAADTRIDLPPSSAARVAIANAAFEEGTVVEGIALRRLDHGALVPLFFLAEAGWRGNTVVFGLPADPTPEELAAFGRALTRAAGPSRWALIASGDCSHRLIPGAPAGFHPEAQRFDRALTNAVASGDDRALFAIDPALRELAAEDVLDTLAIAAAATGQRAEGRRVLSYEAPFGVGYLVAVLHDDAATAHRATDQHSDRHTDQAGNQMGNDDKDARVLLDVAKDALQARFEGRRRASFDTSQVKDAPYTGCFVTWRKQGELRGCVGRMSLQAPLVDTVAEMAVSAAHHDPRFPPVEEQELPSLQLEVSLLLPAEDVQDVDELDPKVWGVEVSAGWRRGVLLPDIEGVTTVEEQLSIVLRKAGIAAHEQFSLQKFKVHKVGHQA